MAESVINQIASPDHQTEKRGGGTQRSVLTYGTGRQNLTITRETTDFHVRVRRQDSTIHESSVMVEYQRFLDAEFPNVANEFKIHPPFKYNQGNLSDIQGFPEEARKKEKWSTTRDSFPNPDWTKKANSDFCEAKTVHALVTQFQCRTSLLLPGLKIKSILKLVRESAVGSLNTSREKDPYFLFNLPLTTEEKMLAEALGFNLSQVEADLVRLIAETPQTPTISQTDLMASVESVKPGSRLIDKGEKQHINTLKTEVKTMFIKLAKIKRYSFRPNEVKNYLTRFLFGRLEMDGEFDLLVADRPSSTIIQVEVKSYPQDGEPDAEHLTSPMKKAKEQMVCCCPV